MRDNKEKEKRNILKVSWFLILTESILQKREVSRSRPGTVGSEFAIWTEEMASRMKTNQSTQRSDTDTSNSGLVGRVS